MYPNIAEKDFAKFLKLRQNENIRKKSTNNKAVYKFFY